jgi:hypothetical protein
LPTSSFPLKAIVDVEVVPIKEFREQSAFTGYGLLARQLEEQENKGPVSKETSRLSRPGPAEKTSRSTQRRER